MGGYIEEHQARLNSITSCRCGETIHARSRVPEEDQRSELSYAEPVVVQNASPIPIPTSAPLSTPPPAPAVQGNTIMEDVRVQFLWLQNLKFFQLCLRKHSLILYFPLEPIKQIPHSLPPFPFIL